MNKYNVSLIKRIVKLIPVSLLVFLATPGTTQDIGYEVFGTSTHPYLGWNPVLTLDTLENAQTLQDIYARYPSSWVSRYLSVELTSTCDGKIIAAKSQNDTLTDEQMAILRKANESCAIDVTVDYIPENNLRDNPPRQYRFALRPVLIKEAKFPGGYTALKDFLHTHVIEGMNAGPVELLRARFVIDETGRVSELRISSTSGSATVDELVVQSINTMPKWIPALNAQGTPIPQEFEFTMGTDLLRCDWEN